jgi:hypothetical protein
MGWEGMEISTPIGDLGGRIYLGCIGNGDVFPPPLISLICSGERYWSLGASSMIVRLGSDMFRGLWAIDGLTEYIEITRHTAIKHS